MTSSLVESVQEALSQNATVDDGIQYAWDVINGKIVAGDYVKKACWRFVNDLKNADSRNLKFSKKRAAKVLEFFPFFCSHVEGELTGQPIVVEPWQAFILINLFGWYKFEEETEQWVRRFNIAYIEVARKNSKSTLLSGIALFMTGFDGEGGAQVYSAATKKDQAKIVFDAAAEMVKKSKTLGKVFDVHKTHIETSTFCKFKPLSKDADSLDGLNVHCAIIDELHAHKKRDLFDVVLTGTGARTNPMIPIITTAGFNKDGICYEQRAHVIKILHEKEEDDSYFGIIFTLDDDDDPFDESVWPKANPNLGKSKKVRQMRTDAKQAKLSGLARINFLVKHLNIWTDAGVSWMDVEKWVACTGELPDDLHSLPCWVGIDYAPMWDITAVLKLFVDFDKNKWYVVPEFYYCKGNVSSLPEELANKFTKWEQSGYMKLFPGSLMDLDRIEARIYELRTELNIQEICLDPWNTYQLTARLMENEVDAVHVGQTVKNFTEAMKFTEGLVFEQYLVHDNNPVMNWMMANVEVKPDANDNIFPRKADDLKENKIDGPTALFTGMHRAMINGTTEVVSPNIR